MLGIQSKLAVFVLLIPVSAFGAVQDSTYVTTPSMAAGMIIPGNLTVTGTETVGTGSQTVVLSQGAVNAAAAIQAASIAAIGNIISSAGNVAASGTVSGAGIVAGSSGVTSQGSVLSLGSVQGSSLAGALAGTYVQGAVALATNATKAAGTSVICNNGVVEGTDASGNFSCQNMIANSTNAADAVAAQSAAELSGLLNGDQIFGDITTTGTITGQALVGTGTIVSQGNVFATGPIWSTTGVGTNGTVAAGGDITSVYGNIATTWGGFVGNLNGTATAALSATTANNLASSATVLGSQVSGPVAQATTATNAVNATIANQANGLTAGATVAGSQIVGPVGSATYATSSGSSTTTQYALQSGYTGGFTSQAAAQAAVNAYNANVIAADGGGASAPFQVTGPSGTYWTYSIYNAGNAIVGQVNNQPPSNGNGGGSDGNGGEN